MTRLVLGTLLWAMAALLMPMCAADDPSALPAHARAVIRRIAIQHNGRYKPFDSFAREVVRQITGAPRVDQMQPVDTVVAIMARPESWQDRPLIAVPFIPLREALGVGRDTPGVSYNALIASRALMRRLPPIVAKQEQDEKLSMLDNETMDAFQRFVALSNLLEHRLDLVPPPPGSTNRVWRPILQPDGYPTDQQRALREAWTGFIDVARSGNASSIDAAADHLSQTLRSVNPAVYPASWRIEMELFYNDAAPFRAARLLYGLAALGLLLGLTTRLRGATTMGFVALLAGYCLHGAGILMRVVLGGRPPVSNFFETMLWLPFVAMTVALIFEWRRRVRYVVLAGAILAGLTLLLADYVPLDASITPVVAVLHSNLWLTIHVLTIVASYGALALAAVLAHVYAVLYLGHRRHPALAVLDQSLYRTMQVGVVLLAGGIMLGAVWANASWGRYWGWDPKETWALITLLWFLALLHGRFAGWLRGIGVALSTIGGFFLLLMTYYGVSFYLVGLHSYAGGHATPVPPLLIAYLIAEAAFLLVVGFAARRRSA